VNRVKAFSLFPQSQHMSVDFRIKLAMFLNVEWIGELAQKNNGASKKTCSPR
jgi:hypothetical protein